jgi:thiol-disulfide isomerase/thioredoxin
MNKKLLVVVVAVVVAIGGGLAYLATQNKTESPPETPAAQETPADTTGAMSGRYIDYDESELAKTEDTKILFFHAPWCPQCRALETDILDKGVPDGVTIFKVDYDSNQALRQKYGVTIQTTLVKVDGDGNSLGQFVAYSEPTLESVKQNLLQ